MANSIDEEKYDGPANLPVSTPCRLDLEGLRRKMSPMASRLGRFAIFGALFACLGSAQAQILWNESVNGDLSGDRLNPTNLSFAAGNNRILGTMGSTDKEYVHFTLAPGMALSQIIVVDYQSGDPISFIGVQAGNTFTEPASGTEVANLLGYTLFGTDHIGTNILPAMGTGSGSMGFTPPLTGSDYTFWIQQTGDTTTYDLNFVTTVPEPGTLSLGVGAALLLLKRRRARK